MIFFVPGASKGWEWASAMLANHFAFSEDTVIRFFGFDMVVVLVKNDT